MNRHYNVRYAWSIGTDHTRPGHQKIYADSASTAASVVRQKLRHTDSLTIHSVT